MLTSTLRLVCRLIDFIVKMAGYLAASLMPLLALVVAFEVFSRYILSSPTIWGYDTALFLFGYIAALGGAYAQQKKSHINVDIFYLKVSAGIRSFFDLITASLGIFFLYIIVVMAFGKYQEAVDLNYRTQSEWAAPMWHFWLMMVIAGCLFVMQLSRGMLANLYYIFTKRPLLLSDEVDDSDDISSSNTTLNSSPAKIS